MPYTGSTVSFHLDTLLHCAQYQWGVRTQCKHGDSLYYSSYVNGTNFTTTCDTGHLLKTTAPVKVSPNPAFSSIQVTADLKEESAAIITVSDVYGNKKLIQKFNSIGKKLLTSIDVSRLPKGTYFITVVNGKNISKATFIKAE